jgi:hypothetical protein
VRHVLLRREMLRQRRLLLKAQTEQKKTPEDATALA